MKATQLSNRNPTGNVLRLGERVTCKLGWALDGFDARIIGFPDDSVRVRAVYVSDDPMVENEWTVPFSWLTSPTSGGPA